jgi:hypothetical protein
MTHSAKVEVTKKMGVLRNRRRMLSTFEAAKVRVKSGTPQSKTKRVHKKNRVRMNWEARVRSLSEREFKQRYRLTKYVLTTWLLGWNP